MSDDSQRNESGEKKTSQDHLAGNIFLELFRFLVALADIGIGIVLFLLCFGLLNNPAPWGNGPPDHLIALTLFCLGAWLVLSGLRLFVIPRPRNWNVAAGTNVVAGVGTLVFIPEIFYQSQYVLDHYPGHMAMEGALANGIISIALGVIAGIWFLSALLMKLFYSKDKAWNTSEKNQEDLPSDSSS